MPNDRAEKFRKKIEEQPVRNKFEEVTDEIPEGPMGKVGGGNLLGAGGFLAVETTRPFIEFIPGVKQPGYKVTAHGTKDIGDGIERHVITVAAISEDVAEFVAEYTAAASNIDYLRSDIETVEIKDITERGTYSTYQFTVDVNTKGAD